MPRLTEIRVQLLTPCDLLACAFNQALNLPVYQTQFDLTISTLSTVQPDIMLVDKAYSDNLPQLLQFLKKRWPETHIIIFSVECDGFSVKQALDHDAMGFVCLKDSLSNNIQIILQTVMAGRRYLSPYAQQMFLQFKEQLNHLTPSQQDVLILLLQCKSPSEIAQETGRNIGSVYQSFTQLRRIFEVENNVQLVEKARKSGYGVIR